VAAVGVVLAALIAYALYRGCHFKVGLKAPLVSFFFESEDGSREAKKSATK
jgi:hypothetical protein